MTLGVSGVMGQTVLRTRSSLTGHDRIVLRPGIVSQADRMPDHNISIFSIVLPINPCSQITLSIRERLVSIIPSGVQLIISVCCHPEGMESILGSLTMPRVGMSEKHLLRRTVDGVCNWLS